MPNELDEFLKSTENTDPFAPEVTPETVVETPKESDDEDDELKPKNRRERRLLRKLEAERESSIFMAGKLEALQSAHKTIDEESDYLKSIERIYGTDTPEAIAATELLKKAMVGVRDDAEERAYRRVREEREQEQRKVAEAESQLDSIIDDIEDSYGVELTTAQEKSYFTLLQKMSPKDEDGNVVSLADPHAVWEVFSERINKNSDNRAKELSARSMVQSGASKDSTLSEDANLRALREMGIL